MVIEPQDEVWFISNNRIHKGIVLQEEEYGVEGWYSLYRVKTKYGSQIIEDYHLFATKEELVDEISPDVLE
jgi:hypothetical protein